MFNSKSPFNFEQDPWQALNKQGTLLEYPSLDSLINYRPDLIQKQQEELGFKPILVTPQKLFPNQSAKLIPNEEIKKQISNLNFGNDQPLLNRVVPKRQHLSPNHNNNLPQSTKSIPNISSQTNLDRQRQKIFSNNLNVPLNNTSNKISHAETQKVNPKGQSLPINLWSSRFASVLKRNIQLSMFQIKKKVNDQGRQNENWVEDQKKIHKSKYFNPGAEKIQDHLNEQIILIEASPQQRKIKQLQKRGQTFQDDEFPPNQQSLTGQWGPIKAWKDITWKRISSLIQNPVIFDKKIIPESIKQGILGDCYLLAGLAALAQRPQRISNLFLTIEQNPQRYYAVKILYKGMWKTIDVDQYIPVIGNKPIFSKAQGQQLWVILLEKAWAKMYGSYKNIQAGYPQQGLHDFTGAHVQMLRIQRKQFDPEFSWKYLIHSTKRKFSMIASSQPGSDTNQLCSGVVLGHAYTVMAVYQIQINGKLQRLIKLRNPWGRTQTKGPWSQKDPVWKMISKQQKQRLGYNENSQNGIFYQAYRDFLRDFRTVTVAEVSDTASYVYNTQQTHPHKGCYFKVTIFKQGQYSLQINQTPDRMFSKQIQNNFKYHPSTLLIGRMDGNKVRYYEGSQQPYRTIYKKHNLIPGDYVIFTKIYYNKHEVDYSVTLSIYGESACVIQPCSTNFCPNFKQRLYLDKAKQSKYKQLKTGVFYNQQILTQGYIYCAMWNRSNRPAQFLINIQKNQNPSVRIKKPFQGQKDIKMYIQPNKDYIILARVPDFTNPTGGLGSVQFVG